MYISLSSGRPNRTQSGKEKDRRKPIFGALQNIYTLIHNMYIMPKREPIQIRVFALPNAMYYTHREKPLLPRINPNTPSIIYGIEWHVFTVCTGHPFWPSSNKTYDFHFASKCCFNFLCSFISYISFLGYSGEKQRPAKRDVNGRRHAEYEKEKQPNENVKYV